MNYSDDFIRSVRSRSRFASDAVAVNAIRAVLEVLGRRISIGQADDLAAALPLDFRPSLLQSRAAESFRTDNFLAQIADKEGIDRASAEAHARAVLSAVAATVSKAELLDTMEQLPKEMRYLFGQAKKAA